MNSAKSVAIIAAAGKGARFGATLKLLADVGGVPCVRCVVNAIEGGLGPHRQIVVVGHAADQVRAAIGDASNRTFVYQAIPRGTGDALRQGLQALQNEDVDVVYFFCGDKPLLSAQTVARFKEIFYRNNPDMMFLTGCLEGNDDTVRASAQGRVVQSNGHLGDGHVLAIVERKEILAMAPGEVRHYTEPDGSTYAFSQEELLGIRDVNVSTYAWKAGPLREHIGDLSDQNAQGEYLVTDLVEIFIRRGRTVRALPLLDPREGKGIDTVKQWEEVQGLAKEKTSVAMSIPHPSDGLRASGPVTTRASQPSVRLHRPSQWLERFDQYEHDRALFRELTRTYGSDAALIRERVGLYRQLLLKYREHYGNQPVALFRVPARISLNPHSDHQGSFVLYATHGREILLAAGQRTDLRFSVSNVDGSYRQDLVFDPAEEIARAEGAWRRSWLEYIEEPKVQARVETWRDAKNKASDRTSTLNYVQGAVLRLLREQPDRIGHGLNMVLYGDVPAGGGMSSSSAVVVSAALAVNDLFGMGFTREELVGLMGEAEWYVGTRGGSGDHAAMLLAGRGEMANVQFDPPFQYRQIRKVRFPTGYQILLVGSGVRSEKSLAEKLLFNRGIFAYKFAFAELQRWLRKTHKELGIPSEVVEGTHCLADLNVERLSLRQIYQLLAHLPQTISPQELAKCYGDKVRATAHSFFGTDDLEKLTFDVPLRGAAMYGLARADRGLIQDQLLAAGDEASLQEFGRLLSIAHDGDRLFQRDEKIGQMVPYHGHRERLTDAAMNELILRGAKPGDFGAQLRYQPGFYGASIRELDLIVDLAGEVQGVLGAGLMGAGGGGIVEIVARAEAEVTETIESSLASQYYEPRGWLMQIEPWRSVAAAARFDP